MKRLAFISAAILIALIPALAQPARSALQKADLMKRELSLTDKQYKKVLKVFKQEEKALHPDNSNGMGGPGGGPGMGGSGMGGPGGGPGMGGPGGGPGMGAPDGQRPQGPPPGMQQLSDDELDKIIAKKEKQLRKILTPEQFNKWAKSHPEEFSPIVWNDPNPFFSSNTPSRQGC